MIHMDLPLDTLSGYQPANMRLMMITCARGDPTGFRGTAPPVGASREAFWCLGSPLAGDDGLDGAFRELPVAI